MIRAVTGMMLPGSIQTRQCLAPTRRILLTPQSLRSKTTDASEFGRRWRPGAYAWRDRLVRRQAVALLIGSAPRVRGTGRRLRLDMLPRSSNSAEVHRQKNRLTAKAWQSD